MKIITERKLLYRLLFACIPFSLLFLGSACKKDNTVDDMATRLTGTWHQTSQTKNGVAAAKDSTHMIMQINANSICILCDSSKIAVKTKTIIKRSGWSYTGGLFNLAIDLPASWTPVADPNTLTLDRIDFNQAGSIVKTRLTFQRTANLEIK